MEDYFAEGYDFCPTERKHVSLDPVKLNEKAKIKDKQCIIY